MVEKSALLIFVCLISLVVILVKNTRIQYAGYLAISCNTSEGTNDFVHFSYNNTSCNNDRAKRHCSYDVILKHVMHAGKLPGLGRWDKTKGDFIPGVCEPQTMTARDVRTCFLQTAVDHIVVMGDSNGARYFKEIVATFRWAGATCVLDKKEPDSYMPNGSYYQDGLSHSGWNLTTTPRPCHSCFSRKFRCFMDNPQYNGTVTHHFVSLEMLALTSFKSSTLSVWPVQDTESVKGPLNYQEIITRLYLGQNLKRVVIIVPPLNHIHRLENLTTFLTSYRSFQTLLRQFVSRRPTTLYMWSAFREFSPKKAVYRQDTCRPGGVGDTCGGRIARMNDIILKELNRDISNKNASIRVFYDLDVTSRTRAMWTTDGIHMQRIWYRAVVKHWMDIHCG